MQLVSKGPLRISDLRQSAMREGDQIELGGGKLLVNKSVIIRKEEPRRVLIEGPYGADFFRARKRVYSQFHAL